MGEKHRGVTSFNFQIENFDDFLMSNLVTFDLSETDSSITKLLLLEVVVELNKNADMIYIIEDFDNNLDLEQMLTFIIGLKGMMNNDSAVLLFSKSPSLIRYLYKKIPIYLCQFDLLSMEEWIEKEYSNVDFEVINGVHIPILTDSEAEIICDRLVSTKIYEICEILCTYNSGRLSKNLKKLGF